jgi:hypothetical protein
VETDSGPDYRKENGFCLSYITFRQIQLIFFAPDIRAISERKRNTFYDIQIRTVFYNNSLE